MSIPLNPLLTAPLIKATLRRPLLQHKDSVIVGRRRQTSDFCRENCNLLVDCIEVRQGRRGFDPKAGHC